MSRAATEAAAEAAANEPCIIAIEGPIAAGKSYLCRKIAEKLNYEIRQENVPEHFLSCFYSDPARYALPFQLRMFYERHYNWKLELEAARRASRKPVSPVLMDRTVYGDLVFATANYITGSLERQDYELYMQEFRVHMASSNSLDGARFLYLDATPGACLERIRRRGVASEQGMPRPYLETLYLCYFNLVMCMIEAGVCVRVCDWEKLPDDQDIQYRVLEVQMASNDASIFSSRRIEPYHVTAVLPATARAVNTDDGAAAVDTEATRTLEVLRYGAIVGRMDRAKSVGLARDALLRISSGQSAVGVARASDVQSWFGGH